MSDIYPNVAGSGIVPSGRDFTNASTHAQPAAPSPDNSAAPNRKKELYRNLKLLFTEGKHVVCIRTKEKATNNVWSGNYDDFKRLAVFLDDWDDENIEFTFICTNPVDPEKTTVTNCLSRGESLKSSGVLYRHNLLIDVDTLKRVDAEVAKLPPLPTCPTPEMLKARRGEIDALHQKYGDVATATEREASARVRDEIVEYLRGVGFAEPIVMSSGNGWHLIYRLPDLVVTKENELLIERVQLYLKQTFTVPGVCKIDVFKDPNRMTRFYGTFNRKGYEAGTPYWQSALVSTPKRVESTPVETLWKVAELVPGRQERLERAISAGDSSVEGWMVEEALEAYTEAGAIAGFTDAGDDLWNLLSCPWESEHSSKPQDTTIQVSLIDGVIGFNDLRASCQTATDDDGRPFKREWKHFRAACDPDRKLYKFPIDDDDLLDEVEMVGIDEMELDDAVPEEQMTQAATLVDGIAPEPGSKVDELPVEEVMRILGARPLQLLVPETAPEPVPEVVTPREKFGEDTPEQLGEAVLNILFRASDGLYANFALYRKRMFGRIKQVEDNGLRRSLYYLCGYEKQFRKLPTKAELLDFIANHEVNKADDSDQKLEAMGYLRELEDSDPTLTLDTTMQRFFHKTDLRVEKKAWKKGYALLKSDEDILNARQTLRKVWSESLALGGDHGYNPGAVQEPDHIRMLKDEFRKDVEGTNNELKFRTGFPSMDMSTMNLSLDGERAIVIYGPSNNAKTSIILSLAYNFAKGGKNGIIFVGEHQATKMEKRIALLHSHAFKNQFTIPPITHWEGKEFKPNQKDLERMHQVLDDLGSMTTLPGYVEVKNINSIGGTLDSVLGYLESTHKKYNWDFFIIDPFDSVVTSNKESEWQAGADSVNRLFDYTRDYQGGRGILCAVTAQLKSREARDIEKLQTGEDEERNGIIDVLRQDKGIQMFTTISQRFDLALGVALLRKKGREGVIVQGRTREGADFDWLQFKLDPHSWYAQEKNPPLKRNVEVEYLNPDDID